MRYELKGFLAAVLAFLIWGILPFYWKELKHIPSLEIIAYRIFMTFVILSVYFVFKIKNLKRLFDKKTIFITLISALFLALNWLIYVWGVNNNRIIECSLGYYITPIASVLFGKLFFKERFSITQTVSIFLAVLSVLLLTFEYGVLPYVAIGLAFSFSFYSVFRKKSPLESVDGLFLEMLFLSGIALFYIIFFGHNLLTLPSLDAIFLLLSGFVTAIPLLLYVYSIRVLRLSTVGMLQYLSPSIMLIIGLLVYKETFSLVHFLSFLLIWIAVFIFISHSTDKDKKVKSIKKIR